MEAMKQWFLNTIGQWMPASIFVMLVSMIPVIELRGGIILGRLLGLPLWECNLFCIIGNIIPIPFILLFLQKVFTFLKNHRILVRFIEWLEKRAEKKEKGRRVGEFLFLFLFVAIPLPGTGAWTGSLIASLFHYDIKKASLAIGLGVLGAAIIMDTLAYFVPGLFGFTW